MEHESFTPQERKALASFHKTVLKVCGPSRCSFRLFGSRARGAGDEESDIDVLVLLNPYDEKTKREIWDAAYRVFSETEILISPMVLSNELYDGMKKRERLIAMTIEKEGIPLDQFLKSARDHLAKMGL